VNSDAQLGLAPWPCDSGVDRRYGCSLTTGLCLSETRVTSEIEPIGIDVVATASSGSCECQHTVSWLCCHQDGWWLSKKVHVIA
jgi:hypothetical protein